MSPAVDVSNRELIDPEGEGTLHCDRAAPKLRALQGGNWSPELDVRLRAAEPLPLLLRDFLLFLNRGSRFQWHQPHASVQTRHRTCTHVAGHDPQHAGGHHHRRFDPEHWADRILDRLRVKSEPDDRRDGGGDKGEGCPVEFR